MSDLGDIHPIDPITGVWPFDHLPGRIRYLSVEWELVPALAQYEGWVNEKLIAGYREDTPAPERSRHMYVFQEGPVALFVVDHRETNPKYDLPSHLKEFAKAHPVVSLVVVGAAGAALGGLFAAAADFLGRGRR